jgi:ring-1,2-phenylacetyl-CoA epoxidase subunit PaaA
MAQEALNRYWYPTLMMFGPPDSESPNSAELMRWQVKLESNDDLRQRWVNRTIPQVHAIGLELPDPELRYDEKTRNWNFTPPNWDEFWQVIKGNGPCNRERIKARRKAQDDGRWVREAAEAYAAKHASDPAGAAA